MKNVVVTGMGCVTPIGNNVEEFYYALMNGVSGAAPITYFDATHHKTQFACEVKNFNPLDYMDKKEARKMPRVTTFVAAAAHQAVLQAGILGEDGKLSSSLDATRAGAIIGSGIGGLENMEIEMTDNFNMEDPEPRYSPFYVTKMIANMSAAQLTIKYGLKGASFATVSACASGNHAFVTALNFIRCGMADIILAGGGEQAITPSSVGGFNTMKALSTDNENYATASRPYDKNRTGFVMGAGAGVLVLEEEEHALRRGAKIYARLCGGGLSSDAYHISATLPSGEGAELSMSNAIKDSGLKPEDINYINTHGTSTIVGDMPELFAIERIFGNSYKNVYISSTKSMTGHLLGAASAIEAVASILAINHGMIPPTINVEELDEAVPANSNIVVNKAVETEVNYAMSNSFGFGGHNATVVFGKYIPRK